jgi:hypothetical protein
MRRYLALFALLALASPLASAPAAAQGGLVPLDSAALAALAPLASRIDSAPVLRLRTLWGNSVLVAPRLVPSGIQYRDLTGEPPRIDGRAFRLQRRGHATGTGAILGGCCWAPWGPPSAGIWAAWPARVPAAFSMSRLSRSSPAPYLEPRSGPSAGA